MQSMNEHVATYYMTDDGSKLYDVYACYDDIAQYDIRDVQFYDVYDKNGTCVSEGDPFYTFPTWDEIFKHYYRHTVK